MLKDADVSLKYFSMGLLCGTTSILEEAGMLIILSSEGIIKQLW